MKQGRQATFEERVEIVNYTIAHGKDYQAAIEKNGSQGLVDRRVKGLESRPDLTEIEQL